jgi:hypothetical protein
MPLTVNHVLQVLLIEPLHLALHADTGEQLQEGGLGVVLELRKACEITA